jgi:hypothetical protein
MPLVQSGIAEGLFELRQIEYSKGVQTINLEHFIDHAGESSNAF